MLIAPHLLFENLTQEQLDPYQRKQQRRASLLKRYGYTGSPAPTPDNNEEVEEGWDDSDDQDDSDV